MGHIRMSVVMAKSRGEGQASEKAITIDIEQILIAVVDLKIRICK